MKWVVYGVGGLAGIAVLAGAAWLYTSSTIETPKYAVIEQEGAFELRDYPDLLVAEVSRGGARDGAVRSGFQALAGYIFARDRAGESIAMTAPVLQAKSAAAADPWRVSFVMPARYTLEMLPRPAQSDIRLGTMAERRLAAVRFSGSWSDALFQEKETALRAWLAARGLKEASPPIYAYYNDPFTPGFLRRNEVLIEIAAVED